MQVPGKSLSWLNKHNNAMIIKGNAKSQYSLFELAQVCLDGNLEQAIYLLRQATDNLEPTLILWSLTQEIRQLIELNHLSGTMPFNKACQQLQIWSQKLPFYNKAHQRLPKATLQGLLTKSQAIDSLIKSGSRLQVMHSLENLIIGLCAID